MDKLAGENHVGTVGLRTFQFSQRSASQCGILEQGYYESLPDVPHWIRNFVACRVGRPVGRDKTSA